MFDKLKSDFRAVFEMDPAATSKVEVIFMYSGFHAIVMHRMAHWLYKMGMPLFAKAIAQFARFLTGVEIHPAARIGGSFFIDHGMGVVIGETSEIGEHVVMFQGSTLGGTGKERGKRHPTVGNHVVIGAGSKVLGGITIGDHVKVGANAVVLRSVPPHSTVVGVPGRVVRVHGERTMDEEMLDHAHMPDPLNEMLTRMQKQISRLEQQKPESKPQGQKAAAQEPEPGSLVKGVHAPKGRSKRREPRKAFDAKPGLPSEVAKVLPEETVQERQARMSRMEKEERMKALALRRAKEDSEQSSQEGAGEQGQQGLHGQKGQKAPDAARKRVRRRRGRGPRGQGTPEAAGAETASGEGHNQGGENAAAGSAPEAQGSGGHEGSEE